MLAEYIRLFTYATYAIYVFAIGSGILICISVAWNLDKLKESQSSAMQPETSPSNMICRFLFGLCLIGINFMSMYSLASLGAEESYIKDPYAQLGYMNSTIPSEAELVMALFFLTFSRCIGAFSMTMGFKHGQYIAHPQENVRKSARLRLLWGVFCGVIFIFPEFWMMIAEKYYSNAVYFSDLFKRV